MLLPRVLSVAHAHAGAVVAGDPESLHRDVGGARDLHRHGTGQAVGEPGGRRVDQRINALPDGLAGSPSSTRAQLARDGDELPTLVGALARDARGGFRRSSSAPRGADQPPPPPSAFTVWHKGRYGIQ